MSSCLELSNAGYRFPSVFSRIAQHCREGHVCASVHLLGYIWIFRINESFKTYFSVLRISYICVIHLMYFNDPPSLPSFLIPPGSLIFRFMILHNLDGSTLFSAFLMGTLRRILYIGEVKAHFA